MKILKHVGAILLATVSVVIILGLIDSALDNDMKPLDGTSLLVFIFFGVLPMAGAVALLRNIAINRPPVQCPNCGISENTPAGVLTRAFNPWIFLSLGWIASLLWGLSRKKQVRCIQCESLYFIETIGSLISSILLWIVLLLTLLGIIDMCIELHNEGYIS
jgi:hypothetical protein